MKFDRSNKFDLCYYGQVNTFGSNIYFAGDNTMESDRVWRQQLRLTFFLSFLCNRWKLIKNIIKKLPSLGNF